jgi:hypothetical protein
MSEWIRKLTDKYSEVNENKKAALQKKLAKSAQSSAKGKAAVTLPKAPFKIPEEIAATERTAFMGAAAAAHKSGKSHFNFAGKKHKVTMQKDTAKAIADDVEEAYNEPQGQAKSMMSPLQKIRIDKEKADRDKDGKLKKEENLDEISVGKMMKYSKAAGKDIEKNRNTVKTALDQPASPKKAEAGLKSMKTLRKRSRGSDMYVNKMTGRSKVKPTAEAYENIPKATHKGVQDPMGKGLSPSAKDQLAKKMPTPEPIDEPKVDAKNFKTFRKGLKQAKKRPGDK